MSMSEYAEQANNETIVCVQLEEAEAVRNVDEIVQVPRRRRLLRRPV